MPGSPPRPARECLSLDELERFAAGLGDTLQRARVEGHVDECSSCRRTLAEAVGSAADEVPLLTAGASVGRFRVIETVGAGAMGVVYAAFDPKLERRVALKALRSEAGSDRPLQSLVEEARAMAALAHPNVVGVFDVVVHDDEPYVVMEFVEGQSLTAWLAERRRPWTEVVAAFIEVASGLAAAHARGLVHRDVKPANVLIGDDGRARVTDFGLASWVTATNRRRCGTERYMAPEQRAGEVTPASDQYAMAISLAEALASTSRRVPCVDAVVARATRPHPAARFSSLDELAKRLRWCLTRARLARGGLVALAGAAVLVGLAYSAGLGAARPAGCERSLEVDLSGRVGPAFRRHALPFAESSVESSVRLLSRYREEWASELERACRLHAVEEVDCLTALADAHDGLLEEFDSADAVMVRNAVAAVSELPRVGSCRLAARPALHDEQQRALTKDLSRVGVLIAAGKLVDANARARDALVRARTARSDELLARALVYAGRLDGLLGRPADGEARLNEAIVVADRAGDDSLRAAAWTALAVNDVLFRQRLDRADALFDHAMGALARSNSSEGRAELLLRRGIVNERTGRLAEAVRDLELARASYEQLYGRDSFMVARALSNLGNVLVRQGNLRAAIDAHGAAVSIGERILGPRHPSVAIYRLNLGAALVQDGEVLASLLLTEPGLASVVSNYGEGSQVTEAFRDMVGELYRELGFPLEALRLHELGLATQRRRSANSLKNRGLALLEVGEPGAARPLLREALARSSELSPLDLIDLSYGLARLAGATNATAQIAAGLAQCSATPATTLRAVRCERLRALGDESRPGR